MTAPVVVGISGASGAIYGIEILRMLRELDIPSHLIVTELGARTITIETDLSLDEVRALATQSHNNKDLAASVASGSFITSGMIVAPCSIKTLSGVANSFSMNLLVRAADVMLKQARPLVLMVRETPLHKGHLRLMVEAADSGAHIMPPVPAFYNRPAEISDLVRHTAGRALDLIGIDHNLCDRWQGDPVSTD
ncbi:MAG: UbiX family flavin prenyltransferase [Rhodospirillales bacterium]|jgi:flavin prenyltransferase|nr:UbiX family flavin prenyltransferase [Rhodospirillales bacterium]MBT4038624.1 UbiX family flavin prenyltransferase [Rhodospirillales bacterium]MBT4627616.1 UbiX family flavin prenyltransferase [Rhodospirillales bacterium]MBT5350652.1 UbiX family flavin prenyltransferase [Rhodospirillales bacterium]MBT5521509.1 UbiX family flavin prenyltransferase [Rhodospirillales bacterium]